MVQKSIKKSQKASKRSGKYVIIDYPQENEIIRYHQYTIRIGSSENKNVEVSIDDGPWQSCRFARGYWWYDWSNCALGKHKIVARIRSNKGKILKKSPIKICEYCM